MCTIGSYSITAPFNPLPTESIFTQSHIEKKEQPYWNSSSLENELKEHSCVDVDVHPNSAITDFFEPNEKHPQDILPHLQNMSKGVIVSVGTERSFFDLLLSDEEKCEGLVIRDINPRIKAYVDFNVLLFRITETREEYCILAESPKSYDEKFQRREILLNRIKESPNIPPFLKEYYQKNLVNFASIYYSTSKEWAKPSFESNYFENVNYFENDFCFTKIQTLAKQGKIVVTIGNINDLSFLHNQKIAVVDVSNVPDYAMIDLHGCTQNQPLIIWTALGFTQTRYFSYFPTDLTTQEREELDLLLNKLKSVLLDTSTNFLEFLQDTVSTVCDTASSNQAPTASYSHNTLINIKKYLEENLYEVPGFGCILIDNLDNISKINNIPDEFLKRMIADPKLKRFVNKLVEGLPFLHTSTYIAFMDVPGWKEVFESKMNTQDFLKDVIQELQSAGLVQTFIDRFGKERISQWRPKNQNLLQLQIMPK